MIGKSSEGNQRVNWRVLESQVRGVEVYVSRTWSGQDSGGKLEGKIGLVGIIRGLTLQNLDGTILD